MDNLRQLCAFTNKNCPYYPCHQMPDGEDINCLFCLCPLYSCCCETVGGKPTLVGEPGHLVKDCSHCTLPHLYENEQMIWDILRRKK